MHKYLGITIGYSIVGKVVFTMFDYLEDVIMEAADDLKNGSSYYPESNQLFKIDYNSPSLSPKGADIFHRHVTRLLFASKRARSNIQVCVAFLCTQIKSPTEQDNKTIRNLEELLVISKKLFICHL